MTTSRTFLRSPSRPRSQVHGARRFCRCGETPFDTLTTQILKLLVAVALQSPSVASICGFVFSSLVRPATIRTVWFAVRQFETARVFRSFGILIGNGLFDLRVAVSLPLHPHISVREILSGLVATPASLSTTPLIFASCAGTLPECIPVNSSTNKE